MKTRVVYENGYYYPQYKTKIGFYCTLKQKGRYHDYWLKYTTLEMAQQALEDYFENMPHKQTRQVFPYKTFKQYTDRVPRC